jgi:cytoplasmic iron level regulating protein YaaA (DUF328/UPF0246 family)
MTKKFVIIPCGGAKLETPANARDLYIGSMYRDQLATALTMTTPENIRILSAKHGLIALDTIVEPYDLKMGQKGSVTSETLAGQLDEMLPKNETYLIDALLPKKYAAALEDATADHIENHFHGCAGIGYQKQVLKKIRTKELI